MNFQDTSSKLLRGGCTLYGKNVPPKFDQKSEARHNNKLSASEAE